MGNKRSYEAMATTGATGDDSTEASGPAVKHRKMGPDKKHKAKEGSKAWVKKRARTLQRRFQRDQGNIPADVQTNLERELAAHQQRIEQDKDRKLRNTMISKYHMVRFFGEMIPVSHHSASCPILTGWVSERRKAERLAKKLRKSLATTDDPSETASIKADLHIAEVDEAYARYFPFMERYKSLYPPQSKEKDETTPPGESAWRVVLRTERPPMWKTIEEALEAGPRALEALRDRRAPGGGAPQTTKHTPEKRPLAAGKTEGKDESKRGVSKPQKENGRRDVARDKKFGKGAGKFQREYSENEDSDGSGGGGFFEEDDD